MVRTTLKSMAAGLGIALSLVACTSGANNSTSQPASGQTANPSTVSSVGTSGPSVAAYDASLGQDFSLPLDSYSLTVSERDVLLKARETLIAKCMIGLGFRYDAKSDPTMSNDILNSEIINFGQHGNRRRYGLTSASAARRYGYELPADYLVTSRRQNVDARANLHGFGAATPALLKSIGGCTSDVDKQMSASDQVGSLVSNLRQESFARSIAATTVRDAAHQWASCMQSAGYSASEPGAGVPSAGGQTSTGMQSGQATAAVGAPRQVPKSEINAAVADVTCKTKTGVASLWWREETAIQNQLINQNMVALDAVKQANVQELRRADILVAQR